MVREIIKDPVILTQKSEPFIFGQDDHIVQDMLDTAEAHKENCVGLAAIQIGEPKRVILVRQGDNFVPFINPAVVKKSPDTYYTMEGCLSLEGVRNVRRHRSVMVSWTATNGKKKVKEFNGFTAQILQHEIDHLNGVLI
jgi:peptide deformylase